MRTIRSESGMALMIVTWALALLMVAVFSFSYATKVETSATMTFRDAAAERFLAEGGLERALIELKLRKVNPNPANEDARPWRTDGIPNRFDTDHGIAFVRITAEAGKIDINKSPETILKNLVLAIGVKPDDADIIVDSIEDWRDADNLHRLHGAEDEYYGSLNPPYKAKNADFESIEELLLVRGVTQEILYGTGKAPGLADFITLYAESDKINVSAAPREVLLSLPGMTPEMADAVIAFKGSQEIRALEEFKAIVGDLFAPMSAFITAGDGTVYTIEAIGTRQEKKPGYGIKAVVSLAGTKPSYLYYRSPWEIGSWKKQNSSIQ